MCMCGYMHGGMLLHEFARARQVLDKFYNNMHKTHHINCSSFVLSVLARCEELFLACVVSIIVLGVCRARVKPDGTYTLSHRWLMLLRHALLLIYGFRPMLCVCTGSKPTSTQAAAAAADSYSRLCVVRLLLLRNNRGCSVCVLFLYHDDRRVNPM